MRNLGLTDKEQKEVIKIAGIEDQKKQTTRIREWEKRTQKKFPKHIYCPNIEAVTGARRKRARNESEMQKRIK